MRHISPALEQDDHEKVARTRLTGRYKGKFMIEIKRNKKKFLILEAGERGTWKLQQQRLVVSSIRTVAAMNKEMGSWQCGKTTVDGGSGSCCTGRYLI